MHAAGRRALALILGCTDTTDPPPPEPRIIEVIATALEPAQAPPGWPVMDEVGCTSDGSDNACHVLLRYRTNRPETTVYISNEYWNIFDPTGDDGRGEFIVPYPRGGSSTVFLCLSSCGNPDNDPRPDIWKVTLSGPPLNVGTVKP